MENTSWITVYINIYLSSHKRGNYKFFSKTLTLKKLISNELLKKWFPLLKFAMEIVVLFYLNLTIDYDLSFLW